MNRIATRRALGTGLAATVLLGVPAVASAHHDTGPTAVEQHTYLADEALAKAQALVERGEPAQAIREVRRSRQQMGRAIFSAVKTVRTAGDAAERADGAVALATLAEQRQQNVRRALQAIEAAPAGVEKALAKAVLADTKGRDNALQVIRKIIDKGVTVRSTAGLTEAIEALTAGRHVEMVSISTSLAGAQVGPETRDMLSRTMRAGLWGQQKVEIALDALLGEVPAEAKKRIARAQEALQQSRVVVTAVLDQVTAMVPLEVRPILEQVGQIMRDLLPAAPQAGEPGSAAPDVEGLVPDVSTLIPDISQLIPNVPGLVPDGSGLIPDLTGLIPDIGGLTSIVTDLLQNLTRAR